MAYRIEIDGDACIGSAGCVAIAPAVFALGDDDVAHVIDPLGAPLDDVEQAEAMCPTNAISVVEPA